MNNGIKNHQLLTLNLYYTVNRKDYNLYINKIKNIGGYTLYSFNKKKNNFLLQLDSSWPLVLNDSIQPENRGSGKPERNPIWPRNRSDVPTKRSVSRLKGTRRAVVRYVGVGIDQRNGCCQVETAPCHVLFWSTCPRLWLTPFPRITLVLTQPLCPNHRENMLKQA